MSGDIDRCRRKSAINGTKYATPSFSLKLPYLEPELATGPFHPNLDINFTRSPYVTLCCKGYQGFNELNNNSSQLLNYQIRSMRYVNIYNGTITNIIAGLLILQMSMLAYILNTIIYHNIIM